MRHLVNFGLLFSFSALSVTGVLAYLRPFSITVTQIHIIAGFVTLVLVLMHLLARLPYFKIEFQGQQVHLFDTGHSFGTCLAF